MGGLWSSRLHHLFNNHILKGMDQSFTLRKLSVSIYSNNAILEIVTCRPNESSQTCRPCRPKTRNVPHLKTSVDFLAHQITYFSSEEYCQV
jgi:hypothetical protein